MLLDLCAIWMRAVFDDLSEVYAAFVFRVEVSMGVFVCVLIRKTHGENGGR
jgi:hypothetical protein